MERRLAMLGLWMIFAMAVLMVNPIWAEETATEKININTAPIEELVKLERVGPKHAQSIIDYRQKNPFEKPEDIINVPGIGDKTFELNKDVIVVK